VRAQRYDDGLERGPQPVGGGGWRAVARDKGGRVTDSGPGPQWRAAGVKRFKPFPIQIVQNKFKCFQILTIRKVPSHTQKN
jgi:hypothetical protein